MTRTPQLLAAFSLFLAGLTITPTSTAAVTTTFVETFEPPPAGNDPLFAVPSEPWYSLGFSGSLFVDGVQHAGGTQSLDAQSGVAGDIITFNYGAVQPTSTCPASSTQSISFQLRMASLPASGKFMRFGIYSTPPGLQEIGAYVTIYSDGTVDYVLSSANGAGSANYFTNGLALSLSTYTFTPNAWHAITIQNYNCASRCATFIFDAIARPLCGAGPGTTGFPTYFKIVDAIITYSYNGGHPTYYLDDLAITVPTLPPAPSTRGVSNLVGFAVDPFDQSIIARHANSTGGQDIITYDPVSLSRIGSYRETGCNRVGGVATRYADGKVFTSFLDCNSSNQVTTIRVRDQALGPPDFSGTPCAGESFCDTDITGPFGATGSDTPPSDGRDLGRIESSPWDYSLGSTEPDCLLCVKHATVAWAYSEISGGHVGVYALTMNKGAQDAAASAQHAFAPAGSSINDFCAWRDTVTKKDYLAAVRQDGATRIYQVTVTEQQAAGTIYHVPSVTLTLIHAGNGGFDNGVALGCARDRILVLTAGGQALLVNVKGNILATWSAPSPAQRSVAMSLDGAFGVYGNAGTYHVMDLINRTETLPIPIPSGSLYTTSLHFNAKSMWSATSTGIHAYKLGAPLGTQQVPTGSNRNLTTGILLACTDTQGRFSSTCTGSADPPPPPPPVTTTTTGTTGATSTSSGTGSSSTSESSSSGSGTSSGTGGITTEPAGSTSTGSNSGSSSSGSGGDSGGGDGLLDAGDTGTLLWSAAAVAVALAVGVILVSRRRLP